MAARLGIFHVRRWLDSIDPGTAEGREFAEQHDEWIAYYNLEPWDITERIAAMPQKEPAGMRSIADVARQMNG